MRRALTGDQRCAASGLVAFARGWSAIYNRAAVAGDDRIGAVPWHRTNRHVIDPGGRLAIHNRVGSGGYDNATVRGGVAETNDGTGHEMFQYCNKFSILAIFIVLMSVRQKHVALVWRRAIDTGDADKVTQLNVTFKQQGRQERVFEDRQLFHLKTNSNHLPGGQT